MDLPFFFSLSFSLLLAELSAFANTLKRCRREKKEYSAFSQRTEEASAAQYFQVALSLFKVIPACDYPWAGWGVEKRVQWFLECGL